MRSGWRGLTIPSLARPSFSEYVCLHCRIRIASRSLFCGPILSPRRKSQNTHPLVQRDPAKRHGKPVRTASRTGDHTTSILVAPQTAANYTIQQESHCTQNWPTVKGGFVERCPIRATALKEYQARKNDTLWMVEKLVEELPVQDLRYKIHEQSLGLEKIRPQLKESGEVSRYSDNGSISHETPGSGFQCVSLTTKPPGHPESIDNSDATSNFDQVRQRKANFRVERDGTASRYKRYCSNPLGLRRAHLAFRTILQKRVYTTNSVHDAVATSPMVSSRGGPRPTTFHSEHETASIRERLRRWQLEQDAASQVESTDQTTTAKTGSMFQSFVTRAHENNSLIESTLDEESRSEKLGAAMNEDHAAEPIGNHTFLSQGDLVELLTFQDPTLAIYIRTAQKQAQFYTMDGRWMNRRIRKIYFSVSGFAPRSEVAAILPYLPEINVPEEQLDQFQVMDSEVPRSVGFPLVERMMEFSRASDNAYRKHADKIDNAYNVMADEKNFVYATLSKIASTVLGEPDEAKISTPTLWAVHRALLLPEIGFSVDYNHHRTMGHFEIVARKEVDVVLKVREWLREYQEDIARRAAPDNIKVKKITDSGVSGSSIILDFVERVRSIIEESRKYRVVTQTGSIGPCLIQYQPQQKKWTRKTPNTRNIMLGAFLSRQTVIIRFMELWAARRAFKPGSQLVAMGATILRATGMYEGCLLDEVTGYTFLQEIGVLAPWENRVAFDSRLALPSHHFDFITDKLQDEATASLRSWTPADLMRDLRTDWKDLEVFCVDGAEANEIDDGFSIEGDGQHFWIHVHIANPTAFLSFDDPVAKYAAQLTESLYFPEQTYPMLDPAITQRFLSLAPNRPALTFSAKMSIDGDMVDYKVTSSIVRNVHYFTPETLQENLLPPNAVIPSKRSYRVGRFPSSIDSSPTRRPLSDTITESQKQALQKVLRFTEARRRKRELRGAINESFNSPEVYVHHIENSLPYRKTVRRIEGDPGISMHATEFESVRSKKFLASRSAEKLVPEIMILACEVAALWCKERGVPVIYRGVQLDPQSPSAAEYKELVLDPATKQYGSVPFLVMIEYIHLCGQGQSSVDPVRHVTVGADAYTKITSPLRRFADMIGHWQIEAAIRKETETGKSLIGNTDTSFLPFPRDRLEAMIPRISYRERIIRTAKSYSTLHWGIQLLQRAYYFKEATLPETYQVYVIDTEPLTQIYIGRAKEINFEMMVEPTMFTRTLGGIQLGDVWECKLVRLSCFKRRIYMEPIRLLERGDIKY